VPKVIESCHLSRYNNKLKLMKKAPRKVYVVDISRNPHKQRISFRFVSLCFFMKMGVVSQIQSTPDRDRASKKALTSDFGQKDSNFSEEMQVFRKKII